jgi:transposase-like protein
MQQMNGRQMKGQTIAQLGAVQKVDGGHYYVKSQSGNGQYEVIQSETGFVCNCPDSMYRGVTCKHAYAVAISIELNKQVKKSIVIEPVIVSECLFCHSTSLKKSGVRHNKSGGIQRFACRDCKRTFSVNIGFERMKHNPQAITAAMQLYFSGESLRNTMKSLKLLGVEVSHQTVYNWIEKYCTLMQKYIEKLQPQVSDTWRADELWVKVKGDMKYLFALMDDGSRYLIAQEVAETKFKHDARSLFHAGKELMGKRPLTMITDGLPAYQDAFNKEFRTMAAPRSKHISAIKLSGNMNNNKMERLNGEIRQREKVMRGLKKNDTPILIGYQVFHNAIRAHDGLNGRTPLEECGIKVNGENKWITLIQNATLPKRA